MTIARWLSAGALLLALDGSHARAGSADDPRPPAAEGVVLAGSPLAMERGSGETSFNFAHLRDLWVRVWLAGTATPVQLDLRLIDPQGTLIYEASVPYVSDPTIPTQEARPGEVPLTAFQAKTLGGWVALDYALPISGSVVTRFLSEGTWTLKVEAGGREFSTSVDVRTDY